MSADFLSCSSATLAAPDADPICACLSNAGASLITTRDHAKRMCIALVSSTADMSFLVPAFRTIDPELDLRWGSDLGSLTEIDAAVCWQPQHGLLRTLPNLKLIQSSGAGVDHILRDRDLPEWVPICRAIDPAMACGMAAYVSWAVIHRQRHMKDYWADSAARVWEERDVVLPNLHTVGIAGMGELGRATARALVAIGYAVRGWARRTPAERIDGVKYFAGDSELTPFVEACDTLVCLLPMTSETRGFLDRRLFSRLKPGTHIINVGRGEHLVERDLLEALGQGAVGAATLDTFCHEPLPASSPLWADPRICITPHIASRCDPRTLAYQTVRRLRSIFAGVAIDGVVDRSVGY